MLPNKNITERFDQYAKTISVAGARAGGGCGMCGSEFDQIDKWGSQRFTPTNLTFKKSVYAFDGILISLGSDISTSGTYSDDMITATNLFQSVSPSRALYVNGTEMKSGDSDLILSGSDISILTPEGTGYFIPSGNDNLTVKFGLQYVPPENGSDYTNPASAIAAHSSINHGVKHSNGKYSFVALPGIDQTKLASYAEKLRNNVGEIFSFDN